jgi:hypothetical protein
MVTRSVSEGLQSAPRLRVGLPLRGTSALARESMGETPMPLSNTPFHNPIKQRAGERGIAAAPRSRVGLPLRGTSALVNPWAVGTSLARRVTKSQIAVARQAFAKSRESPLFARVGDCLLILPIPVHEGVH